MDTTKLHSEVLATQLHEALAELAAGQGDPLEVATLGGLIERHPGDFEALREADAWCEGPGGEELVEALRHVDLGALVEHLLDPGHDDDERVDAVFAFDEACAALSFAGAGATAESFVNDAVRSIRAVPEPWAPLAAMATRVLEEAPPLPSDPAGRFWRALEATGFAVSAEATAATVPELGPFPSLPMAAASVLGDDTVTPLMEIHPLARVGHYRSEAGTKIVLEVDPIVRTVALERDGVTVRLTKLRATNYECPYQPGEYVFLIDGEACRLNVK